MYSQSLHAQTLVTDGQQLRSAPIKPVPVRPGRLSETNETINEMPLYQSQGEIDPAITAHLDELIQLGLPALALHIVNQQQQLTKQFSPDWYRFERKRISVLVLQENWQNIIERTRNAIQANPRFSVLPQQIIDWFLTQQSIALMKSGQAAAAMKTLRKLLWETWQYDRGVEFSLWRQLVIRLYLQQDNIADAETAMLRYDYDYRDTAFALTEDWKFTRAGVLLRLGRNAEVMRLMRQQQTTEEQVFYMLAQLRHDSAKSQAIIDKIDALSKGKIISKHDRWAYRYIKYEAALANKDDKKIIAALEDLLSVGEVDHLLKQVVKVDADDWWRRYFNTGTELGNRYQLLTGDDNAWYAKAMELKAVNTHKAIAVLSVLALQSEALHYQQMAHTELVANLKRKKNSMDLITQLYMHAATIETFAVVPLSTRVMLVDHALDRNNITVAAKLMASMQHVPNDQDPFIWQLRKARILILEGHYQQGEQALLSLFESLPEMDRAKIDHLMQALFDLQSVQRHQTALALFLKVKTLPIDFQLQRELYFWMAESNYALSNYADAAMQYLRSARTEKGDMSDQWALSSRLRAAESLVKAGLYADARNVYQQLLKVTSNESRKAMIEQEIQQIYLLKNARRVNGNASLEVKP